RAGRQARTGRSSSGADMRAATVAAGPEGEPEVMGGVMTRSGRDDNLGGWFGGFPGASGRGVFRGLCSR
ncbi:hypothetical protein, partial [Acetobacter oeni]|uniref:hypothetical protein n=1 Tax=Acetobacter oeni TaxID=304077 RepID=UPI001C9A1ABB